MVRYFLLFLFCGLLGCRVKRDADSQGELDTTRNADSSALTEQEDSDRREFFVNVGEPKLKNSSTEAFRFLYNIEYGDYVVLTVTARNKADSFRLKDRMPNHAALAYKLIRDGEKDSVLKSSEQMLNQDEYTEFKELLNGTYYWQLNAKACWDGIVRDGNTAEFESWSYFCGRDTLTYKRVSLAPLYDGNFKEAFRFLLKRAAPMKGDPAAQKSILEM